MVINDPHSNLGKTLASETMGARITRKAESHIRGLRHLYSERTAPMHRQNRRVREKQIQARFSSDLSTGECWILAEGK
jgi:hypothetical protein